MGLEKAESTAELFSVLGILILLVYAAKQISSPLASAGTAVSGALSSAATAVTDLLPGNGPQVTGTQPWVGTATPLTAAQADSIAKVIGLSTRGGSYTLSPNGQQVWFADGSYYDNPSGHIFSLSGQDMGQAFPTTNDSSAGQVTSSADVSTTLSALSIFETTF